MSKITLANRFRPKNFDDLVEQESIKQILTYQAETKTNVNAYLFCGSAGTGKTTTARIFAKMLNGGSENCIEIDAASNNSVDDMRKLTKESNFQDITSDFKTYIIDEVHVLSNQAWQALLKTLEEPPAKTIFILCTTDPQKIPNTILSRVQRFNFKKISYDGIIDRLLYILESEISEGAQIIYDYDAVEYLARISQGGMRDAITSLDKCLSYSDHLTMEVIEKCLDVVNVEDMLKLSVALLANNKQEMLKLSENIYLSGLDVKLFTKQYLDFVVNHVKYLLTRDKIVTNFSGSTIELLEQEDIDLDIYMNLMNTLVDLNEAMKYETNPKVLLQATLLRFMKDNYDRTN